jgi:hypothetical protein
VQIAPVDAARLRRHLRDLLAQVGEYDPVLSH